MGRVATIARRTFLIGSAAIAGGVAFGIYEVRKPHPNPLLGSLKPGEAALTPWVRIDKDAVTLITPQTDLGQGAYSVQAALIAEELDIEFGQFRIDPGVPAAAYYNRVVSDERVPFSAHDTSWQAEAMRGGMSGLFKLLGVMVTGGSSTVPDSFVKLREAGAIARETLKLAASRKTGVPVAQLQTARGAVQLPDGTELKYTELAEIAATLEPVRDVTLREPSAWRLIGKPMQRLDILAKSTGTLRYGIDLTVDGMLHASVKVNPRQGGKLNRYDDAKAKGLRGVKKILPVTNGIAVVADNTWRAIQAVDAIACDWGPAPYPAEMKDHWAAVAASFTPERLNKEWRHDGDADQALAQGPVIEAEYRAPYLAHAPLEPLNAIVKVSTDGVDVWVAHQLPRFVQQKVAAITGFRPEQVRYHQQYAGGSFGHRLEFENVTLCAEIANQVRGTAVKLTYSREEDFAHDFPRQIGMARGRGTVKDGKVHAFDLQVATVSSSASSASRLGQSGPPGPDGQIGAGAWNQPFAVPHFRMRAYKVPELAPTSSWRSVGASTQGFFANAFLDELIQQAGADPLQERLRLCNHDVSRKVLETVGEMSNWGSKLEAGRGRGLAFVDSFGVPVAEVVEVTKTDGGIRIDKVFVALDVGRIVDPINFDNHVKGAVVWGLGHAMNCEITYSDGIAQQTNFPDFQGMRLDQCPHIEVRGMENAPRIRGAGEPAVPPAAPALAAAIFAVSGKRLREMPFSKFVDFA
ncbi:xanthine dehydrogenase family protein molybdopterin-binding subunit [Bradyrhizobium sp. CCBAU 53340]|uniref:xanthine dehydrogenase family protein molybdopterin-binding subunit n=1 Tax=Bradyrhizobium sp. CCBAU 53340 TaxID=1325112 RepID=UPI00188C4330|nr:molybdopterin cofactor-binding domain-containing protein [Bradyrhizobium sp. CCBAU 53340]QOZ48971.1 xanthine dehydrogenase family protein molybdopterin-binding subunit [Bradyrhizobium sp. CCBAU 53340]